MIRILTDSTCDIERERAEAIGVEIIPITIHFADRSYVAGEDITTEEFYRQLAQAETLPTTSQITPVRFEEIFRRYIEAGDEIVGLFISSKLSGTYQSALVARELVSPEKIRIVDTLNVTFGAAILVEEAARMRDRGMSTDGIAGGIAKLVPRIRIAAYADTLKYLKMGGRISATAAVLGGALGILPMIAVVNGEVVALGKVRGQRNAFRFLCDYMEEHPRASEFPLVFAHSDAPEALARFRAFCAEAGVVLGENFDIHIGSVVGTHLGPGAVGVAYVEE